MCNSMRSRAGTDDVDADEDESAADEIGASQWLAEQWDRQERSQRHLGEEAN